MHRRLSLLNPAKYALVAIAVLFLVMPAHAAPKADLWAYWETHDSQSAETIDHQSWHRFLGDYVAPGEDGINRLDYGGVTPDDRAALDNYISMLGEIIVTRLNRNEQKAYWINLYNALTVQVVLDAYPVASIRDIDISPGFFTDGPWGKSLVEVEGHPVSLDGIEHRILRPIWNDPRIHYAVNCASLGCPNLSPRAYRADELDQQLNKAAEMFINHPRGAKVEDGRLTVSSIYNWFTEDFKDTEQGVIEHIRQFARKELLESLASITDIDGYDYDWSLNGARQD